MAIATKPTSNIDQVVRLSVSWSAYESLVESLGDHNHVRLTYDGATLEIMSPGSLHEILVRLITTMLADVATEWDIDLSDLGGATFKTEPRGFEADNTYYVNAERRVRDRENIDLAVDPPPDLLVEIDITTDSSDKLAIFAGIGVPEVWRYSVEGLAAFSLAEGRYVPITVSRAIAGLPLEQIAKRLDDKAGRSNMLTFRRAWRQWLVDHRHLHESP